VLSRLERAVLRGASALYTISPASRGPVARAAGVPEERVRVLPIPVDLASFAPLPDDEWRARLESPLLVFVGRADDPRKNVDLLLRALPAIRSAWPGARVRLVGSPPRAVPEGVEATGPVPDVGPYVREAALFVLPSLQEGFGIVAAEALAAGVPVLATPSGGPEELVRSSGGGVVLSGFDAAELAATATALLGDPDTLVSMRRRGREHVVREHWPERLRQLLGEAFRELI
jgi:phosphatidylinositol alpha-mannosyltransferase